MRLTRKTLVVLAVLGVVLWFVAAMMLRAIGPLSSGMRVLLYALIVPGTVPFLMLMKRVARLRNDDMAAGTAVVTATALLCDGVAFGWFPQLYSSDILAAVASAGAVFWGAGVALVLGFMMNRETNRETL
jgi:hypothetical protein